MIFLYFLLSLVILILFLKICHLFCLPFPKFRLQPSALYTFYGAPGSGKSCLSAFFAKQALRQGITVYSNLPITGCLHFEKDDLGKYLMEDCLVLWDEVGVDANSRNFKSNFTMDNVKWLKYHRHERAMVMVFSQGFDDMDKIIRTLSTDMFVVRKGVFNTITYRKIRKRPDIDEITHKPDDLYAFVPFSTKRIYAPIVWGLFDSYERLGLPSKVWERFGCGTVEDEPPMNEPDPDPLSASTSL